MTPPNKPYAPAWMLAEGHAVPLGRRAQRLKVAAVLLGVVVILAGWCCDCRRMAHRARLP